MQTSLLKSLRTIDNLECVLECPNRFVCSIPIVDSSICNNINTVKKTDRKISFSPSAAIVDEFIKKDPINKYLIHYWPFNGNYNDVVSKANLFNGKNDSLVTDRFDKPSSSLYLNYGSLQAPSGNYIYGDFTVTTWVKMFTLETYRRFLVLQPTKGNIVYLSLTNINGEPYYYYQNGDQIANATLKIGKWQHLAFTVKGSTLSIYIDGIAVYNGITTPISSQTFTYVYFGGDMNFFVNAQLDDIKIFNRSLTQTEIIQSSLTNLNN